MAADTTALVEAPPTGASRLAAWLKKRAGLIAIFVLLFVFWEYAVWLFGVKAYLLPPPSLVWTEFLERWDIVAAGAWVTTQEIIGGYLLAVVVSIPMAFAVAKSRFVEDSIYPVVVFCTAPGS